MATIFEIFLPQVPFKQSIPFFVKMATIFSGTPASSPRTTTHKASNAQHTAGAGKNLSDMAT